MAVLLLFPVTAVAQTRQPANRSDGGVITLDLEEAIQIALVHNYALKSIRLEVEDARQQVREGIAPSLPQITGRSSYIRNLKSANPFAGSAAGDFFSGFAFVDWLNFNESARTDSDPTTLPITYADFADRQLMGLNAAGVVLDFDDNPFAVANQHDNTISISQELSAPALKRLFDPDGARAAIAMIDRAEDRQVQVVADQVREAFYGALLAQDLMYLASASVQRTVDEEHEMRLSVRRGVEPRMARLSAEVETTNRKVALARANDGVDAAMDALRFQLGVPGDQNLVLRGSLEAVDVTPYLSLAATEALSRAMQHRPDYDAAQLSYNVALNEVQALRLSRLPWLEANFNLSYVGRIPETRTYAIGDPLDPFTFTKRENAYFDPIYWQTSMNVGVTLSWTLFDGFGRRARIQRARIAARRSAVELEVLEESIRLEIEAALRQLVTAHEAILAQDANAGNAQINYEHMLARRREGLASANDVRYASAQLDLSKEGMLVATHDYLLAISHLETALGVPVLRQSDVIMTAQ